VATAEDELALLEVASGEHTEAFTAAIPHLHVVDHVMTVGRYKRAITSNLRSPACSDGAF
jgi:hypothetical protein